MTNSRTVRRQAKRQAKLQAKHQAAVNALDAAIDASRDTEGRFAAMLASYTEMDFLMFDIEQEMDDMRDTAEDGNGTVLTYLSQGAADFMLASDVPNVVAAARILLDLPAAEPGQPVSLIVAGVARKIDGGIKIPGGWRVTNWAVAAGGARTAFNWQSVTNILREIGGQPRA